MFIYQNIVLLLFCSVYFESSVSARNIFDWNERNETNLLTKPKNVTIKPPFKPIKSPNTAINTKPDTTQQTGYDLTLIRFIDKVETKAVHIIYKVVTTIVPKRFRYLAQDPGVIPNLHIHLAGMIDARIKDTKLYNTSKYTETKTLKRIKTGTYDIKKIIRWPELVIDGIYSVNSTIAKYNLANTDRYSIKLHNLTIYSDWCWQFNPIRIQVLDISLYVQDIKVNFGNITHNKLLSTIFNTMAGKNLEQVINQGSSLILEPFETTFKGTFNGVFKMMEKILNKFPGSSILTQII